MILQVLHKDNLGKIMLQPSAFPVLLCFRGVIGQFAGDKSGWVSGTMLLG
jgi:hypothetical protein